ncbi:UNVERIFIED_CONTAM: hypothetical protein NCL1_15118 [Trichonephila clavipes]
MVERATDIILKKRKNVLTVVCKWPQCLQDESRFEDMKSLEYKDCVFSPFYLLTIYDRVFLAAIRSIY